MLQGILADFGLRPDNYHIKQFGSGLINRTWKISGTGSQYILQCINKNVFKAPQDIANNLVLLQEHLQQTAPEYLFAAPLQATNGQYLVIKNGDYYRLSSFIENSHTIDFVTQTKQAREAAKQFGKFTRLLNGFDAQLLSHTLPDFHNLSLRAEQFKAALLQADSERLNIAGHEIQSLSENLSIVNTYVELVNNHQIPLRVIHHDAKINNVLLGTNDEGIGVIDLDTVMPGYYISDVGDMMRTYLSEANEEERDLNKINIREDFFEAIVEGYFSEMGTLLTKTEKGLFVYAGKYMIYMQALRFLTDYLNHDSYYQIRYPEHNLVRAQNQLMLLNKYMAIENKLEQIVGNITGLAK